MVVSSLPAPLRAPLIAVAVAPLLWACGDISVQTAPKKTDAGSDTSGGPDVAVDATAPVGFPSDPVAHWAFSGNLDDSSGLGKHLATFHPGVFVADRFGRGSEAYDLDLEATPPSLSAPHVSFTQDFTIAAWVKGTSRQGSSYRIAGQSGWFGLIFFWDGSVKFTTSVNDTGALDPAEASDEWTFYAGVASYDEAANSTTLTLYRAGARVNEITIADTRYDNPGDGCFRIGEDPTIMATACDGPSAPSLAPPIQVDDVRVFDRALSADEVKKLAREGLPD